MTGSTATVIKVGGSVLRDQRSYRTITRLLAERYRRETTWVVASAAHGMTDALEQVSKEKAPGGFPRLLERQARLSGVAVSPSLKQGLREGLRAAEFGFTNRLLAWGEQASVEALQTHLAREGAFVPVVELSTDTPPDRLPSALVPGFYVRDRTGNFRCLPRGGSDISAILVAAALGVDVVRFWKQGGGIRTDQGVLPEVASVPLLGQLSSHVRPLHPAAVRLAIRWGIDMILEDPLGTGPPTRVLARSAGLRLPAFALVGVADLHRSPTDTGVGGAWEKSVLDAFSGGP